MRYIYCRSCSYKLIERLVGMRVQNYSLVCATRIQALARFSALSQASLTDNLGNALSNAYTTVTHFHCHTLETRSMDAHQI